MVNLMLVQCVIASHAKNLDQSVLVEILSRVDSDYGTGPRKTGSVNSRSTLCPIERRPYRQKALLQAFIWLITFCKLDNNLLDLVFFCLR